MLLLLSALLAATVPARAEEPSREYVVKAAYVYRITQFVDWPAEAAAGDAPPPLGLCILGEDPFGETLDYIEEKEVRGRRFALRRSRALGELDRCDVLFISASERNGLDGILGQLAGRTILTISDLEDFARRGGMIGLVVNRRGKVDLEVNLEAAEDAGLQISAKLLELSDIVEGKRRG